MRFAKDYPKALAPSSSINILKKLSSNLLSFSK